MANAVLRLTAEAYDAGGARPIGRTSAGEGFVRGFRAHADLDRLHLWNTWGVELAELEAFVERLGPARQSIRWIGPADGAAIAEAGALAILARLVTGPLPAAALVAAQPAERRAIVERGLVWLAKYGFLRLSPAATRT